MTKGSLKKKDKCQLRSAALSPKKYIGLPALGTKMYLGLPGPGTPITNPVSEVSIEVF